MLTEREKKALDLLTWQTKALIKDAEDLSELNLSQIREILFSISKKKKDSFGSKILTLLKRIDNCLNEKRSLKEILLRKKREFDFECFYLIDLLSEKASSEFLKKFLSLNVEKNKSIEIKRSFFLLFDFRFHIIFESFLKLLDFEEFLIKDEKNLKIIFRERENFFKHAYDFFKRLKVSKRSKIERCLIEVEFFDEKDEEFEFSFFIEKDEKKNCFLSSILMKFSLFRDESFQILNPKEKLENLSLLRKKEIFDQIKRKENIDFSFFKLLSNSIDQEMFPSLINFKRSKEPLSKFKTEISLLIQMNESEFLSSISTIERLEILFFSSEKNFSKYFSKREISLASIQSLSQKLNQPLKAIFSRLGVEIFDFSETEDPNLIHEFVSFYGKEKVFSFFKDKKAFLKEKLFEYYSSLDSKDTIDILKREKNKKNLQQKRIL